MMETISNPIEEFKGKYRFLSNFYARSPVEFDGMIFPSVETAYQAAKTLDKKQRLLFIDITPG